MALELQRIGTQGLGLWQKMPPARRVLVVAVLGTVLAGGAVLALYNPTERFAVLYSGLSPEDAGKVLEQLRAQNVPFQLQAGGTIVEVPASRVQELRISMASSVSRGAGVGFEVFDKPSLGTTSFIEQMNYRRALAGELARTIMSLDAVDRARVHLAMEERSLFKKDASSPSASVAVKLRPGRELSQAQVKGIVNLVASSVEGLKAERVTLVDEGGTVLWSGDDAAPSTDTQRELERTLARRVSDLLDRIVGRGHSVVVVTAEIDGAHTDRTEELYDKEQTALRSESRVEDRSAADGTNGAGASGVAGARGNLPGAPPPKATNAPGASEPGAATGVDASTGRAPRTHLSETRNFEVNRIVNHIIGPKLRVSRLHLAVLIDAGATRTTSTATAGAGAGAGRLRTADLERIGALARAAAGLDPARGDRIEVESVPFTRTPQPDAAAPTPTDPLMGIRPRTLLIAAGAPMLLLAGLAAVALLRRRKKRPELVQIRGLPVSASQAEAMLMNGDRGALGEAAGSLAAPPITARERAVLAARTDSARAARVLSAWLAEPEPVDSTPRHRGGA